MILPNPTTGIGPESSWFNRLLASVKENQLLPGVGYLLKKTSSGTSLIIKQGSGGASSGLSFFHLKSVQEDYVTARTWDGTSEGTIDVFIAKPFRLRESIDSESKLGIVHVYDYASSADGNNRVRTDSWNLEQSPPSTEAQMVIPVWRCPVQYILNGETIDDPGETIAAFPCSVPEVKTPSTDPSQPPGTMSPVVWIMLDTERHWAKI